MVNRDLYSGWFRKEDMSKWQCPTCNCSALKVVKEQFTEKYNSETTINYHEDWFNPPEMIVYTFTALLSCTNPQCKEVVSCSGTGSVEEEYYRDEREYVEYYKPYFFYPALNIFKIPEDTPIEIKSAIEDSFALVFTNKSAAANKIRIALECLLTNLKVKRFIITRRRKRKRLTLHDRILLLATKYDGLKEICSAIKWLGNSGSHCDEDMKFDDVFNGYDMISFLLDEIYANRHHHVKKLAKTINAKKGV